MAERGTNRLKILLNNGSGGFTSGAALAVGDRPVRVVVADLNGDGRADLASADSSGNDVSVLFGNGNGTFTTAARLPAGVRLEDQPVGAVPTDA